jgi:phosphoribosylglycinamide formyltransferase 1
MSSTLDIVVLISGNGSNLQAIIDGIKAQRVHANIKAVISNRPDVKGLQRARNAGISAEVLSHKDYDSRESFDLALQQLIDSYNPGLVVLAGFMRILSEDFVHHYDGRMFNIHPSLLPEFKGLNTHQRVLDANCAEHGASVHFVNSELDSGAVVLQAVISVNAEDDAESLAQRIHQQEHIIYPMAINWFAEGRITYKDSQALLDNKQISSPPRWKNETLETTS